MFVHVYIHTHTHMLIHSESLNLNQSSKNIFNIIILPSVFSRIYEILPSRIQQWQSSPCVAEENNKKMLEKIRRQQLEARAALGELDRRHQALDALIERAKNVKVDPQQLVIWTNSHTSIA